MSVLNDIDAFTWVLTFGAFAICGGVIAHDLIDLRQKRPIRSRTKKTWLWLLAGLSLCFLGDALINPSNAEHKSVIGPIVKVRQLIGRGGDEGMLACISPCSGQSQTFILDRQAEYIVDSYTPVTRFAVGYLADPTYLGSGKSGYKVVDLDVFISHKRVYHFDTQLHPYRTAVLLLDTLLFFFSGILCDRLADLSPDTDDVYENYRETYGVPERKSDLTSIDLS